MGFFAMFQGKPPSASAKRAIRPSVFKCPAAPEGATVIIE